ncbi:MAG: DUF4157 domain-containing protein [Bacteroidia bacterium]|nr:DUF4157 domain-containing protein [Bacteroidia bacterium]
MKSTQEKEKSVQQKRENETNPDMLTLAPPAFAPQANGPVQAKMNEQPGQEGKTGTQGSKTGMPETVQTKMEQSFGTDFSNVNIHQNSGEASSMNALAYTQGNDVHFAPGQFKPDTSQGQELLGHELTHVVQQRAGRVQPTAQEKGFSVNDDKSLESEADTMGAKAARGESTSMHTGGNNAGAFNPAQKKSVVQAKKLKTHQGEFEDVSYTTIKQDGKEIGVDIYLKFHPGDTINATKIGMTQSLKPYEEGTPSVAEPYKANYLVNEGDAKGNYMDQLVAYRNPMYATSNEPANAADQEDMAKYATPSPVEKLTRDEKKSLKDNDKMTGREYKGWGEHGYHYKEGENVKSKDAELHDNPNRPAAKKNSGQIFETTALAIEGAQKGTYFGSVKWGWTRDNNGAFKKLDFELVSDALPSNNFMASAKKWNSAKAKGSSVITADNTKLQDENTMANLGNLSKNTKVTEHSSGEANGKKYSLITVNDGPLKDKRGWVLQGNVGDKGDGKDTLNLPVKEVFQTTESVGLFSDKEQTNKLKDLPKGTRVETLMCMVNGTYKVQVVAGADWKATGYVDQTKLKREQ